MHDFVAPMVQLRGLRHTEERYGFCGASGWVIVMIAFGTLLGSRALLAHPDAPPQQAGAVPLQQAIADLAGKLANGIPEGRPMVVGVTDFVHSTQNRACGLGRFVAERLSTLLSQHPQCCLVERRRLDMVLSELKFSLSELVEPAKARKLGQMLGVQGLVLGSWSDLGGIIAVDARIIAIQTDVSLPGAWASIIKDETVKKLSSNCSQAPRQEQDKGYRATAGRDIDRASTGLEGPIQPVDVADLTFQLRSCNARRSTITCYVLFTSNEKDEGIAINPLDSRIIDDLGNEYRPVRVQLGSKVIKGPVGSDGNIYYYGSWLSGLLALGVPTKATFTFENVSPEATRIALLEIACVRAGDHDARRFVAGITGGRGHPFSAQLRDIPITK